MDIDNWSDDSLSLVSDSGYNSMVSSDDEEWGEDDLIPVNNDAVLVLQRLLSWLDKIQTLEQQLEDLFEE